MYLAHVNFRPVDNGRLVYSAPCTPEHVRVRSSIPSHVKPLPGYAEFLDELAAAPGEAQRAGARPGLRPRGRLLHRLPWPTPKAGRTPCRSTPTARADYIRHRPDQLDHGVRWICRTPDQDALGMVLPATAEPEGYQRREGQGQRQGPRPGGAVFHCEMECGVLTESETRKMEQKIDAIVG